MLTKEEWFEALNYLASGQCSYCWKSGNEEVLVYEDAHKMLTQLINEHFKLVEENERLLIQLVECQRVCKIKQERINELEKGTVSYVD